MPALYVFQAQEVFSILFNRFILIFAIGFVIAGCSNKKYQKVIVQEQGIKRITQTVYLSEVTFSQAVSKGKFKTECAMLPALTKSILDVAQTHSLDIVPGNNITNDQYQLKVEYVEVVPHRWAFLAVRPSSNATIKASVLKGDETLYTTTKLIGSAVAFGACDRLEKISVAQGRYIAQWLFKYI